MTTPYAGKHQRERVAALERLTDGTPCPFCGRGMFHSQALDFDHAIPVIHGGADGPKRLAHASCNRRAGAIIGNKSPKRRNRFSDRVRSSTKRQRLPKW